jgi:hypothetical protein
VERFLYHVDQLPLVIEPTGYLMIPSLKASRTDQVKITGGGYVDNVPIVDGPGAKRTRAVWHALRAYLGAASSAIGVEAPVLPATVPDDVTLARDWAYAANQWLADVVHMINDHPDLAALEESLFGLIRRAAGRRPETGTVRRNPPEWCGVCGTEAVLVDWINGPDGQPVLTRACQHCGDRPTERKPE